MDGFRRSTPDLVLIILTLVVAACVLLSGCGLFAMALLHPDWPLADWLTAFSDAVGMLIGAVLGYLAGRGRSPDDRGRP